MATNFISVAFYLYSGPPTDLYSCSWASTARPMPVPLLPLKAQRGYVHG
jgi:hypothetical protein